MAKYITASDVKEGQARFYKDKFLPLCLITQEIIYTAFVVPVIDRAQKKLEEENKNEG